MQDLQIETEIEVKYRTTIGDNFSKDVAEELADEGIKDFVEKHIKEYCEEHGLDRTDVRIIDDQSDVETRFQSIVDQLENVELTEENTERIKKFLQNL